MQNVRRYDAIIYIKTAQCEKTLEVRVEMTRTGSGLCTEETRRNGDWIHSSSQFGCRQVDVL